MLISRGPKVLNDTLKYKLQPILNRIEILEASSGDIEAFVKECVSKETSVKESAVQQFNDYASAKERLVTAIDESNVKLDSLIKNNLYNPNVAKGVEEIPGGSASTEDTPLISDKALKGIAYGFVKDGRDYALVGVIGKGLAISEDDGNGSVTAASYEWRNPGSKKYFPSYYINKILRYDQSRALISTNNGIVDFNIVEDSYIKRDKSFGLPSNEVRDIVGIQAKGDESMSGFFAATAYGVAFSPNGERWTQIDTEFVKNTTCLSRSEHIREFQDIVFIGTTQGVYYMDCDDFFRNDVRQIKALNINTWLPNVYIYGLTYNTQRDLLVIATVGGVTVVKNAVAHILAGDDLGEHCTTYTNRNGLMSTACYSCLWLPNGKCVIGTSNGLSLTDNFEAYTCITKLKNTTTMTNQLLNSHVCEEIVPMSEDNEYSVLHGVGLTEALRLQ